MRCHVYQAHGIQTSRRPCVRLSAKTDVHLPVPSISSGSRDLVLHLRSAEARSARFVYSCDRNTPSGQVQTCRNSGSCSKKRLIYAVCESTSSFELFFSTVAFGNDALGGRRPGGGGVNANARCDQMTKCASVRPSGSKNIEQRGGHAEALALGRDGVVYGLQVLHAYEVIAVAAVWVARLPGL